jgi:predicted NAD-dependent protein-ADP-ribosyltransferase YbiA (DUF1768 family)
MVLSRINDNVNYPELKRVDKEDINKKANLYETNIKDVDILIAIGNVQNAFEQEDNILYFPIYFLKRNNKVFQIGVFEIAADQLPEYLDEDGNFDVEKANEPLIYDSFVTTEMLDELRMVLKDGENILDNKGLKEDNNDLDNDLDNDLNEEDKDFNEEDKDLNEEDKDLNELIEDNYNESEEYVIPKNREDIFTIIKSNSLNKDKLTLLPEESKQDAKEIKSNYKEKSSHKWIQKFMKNKNYSIVDNEGDGNCFFAVIRDAFKSIGQITTIKELRKKLSQKATEEKYEVYKKIYEDTNKELKNINSQIKLLAEQQATLVKNKDIPKEEKKKINDQMKEEYNKLKQEKEITKNGVLRDFEYMSNVNSFDQFREKIKTKDFWADSWAISELEQILNVKFIILSSDSYHNADKHNVLQCGESGVTTKKFHPEFYIITDYMGNHYTLIGYKDKYIFKFSELPYDIKKLIVNKCLERNAGLFSLIPEFVEMKKSKKLSIKGGSNDGLSDESNDGLIDEYERNYNDNDIVFVFNNNSQPTHLKQEILPGKMSGEKIALNKMVEFVNLSMIPFWRNKLSNQWVQPFTLDNRKWASVEHYCQACKFKENYPAFFNKFSLDSNTEMSKDPEMAKCAGTNGIYNGRVLRPENIVMDSSYPEIKSNILYNAQLAKINQHPDLKDLLLNTKDAMLVHYKKKREPVILIELMKIRNSLNKTMNNNNAYIYA